MGLGIVTHRSCKQNRVHAYSEFSPQQMDHAKLDYWSDAMRCDGMQRIVLVFAACSYPTILEI